GMQGMAIGIVYLLFPFIFQDVFYPCALIQWFVPIYNRLDKMTGIWVVCPKFDANSAKSMAMIYSNCVTCRALLIGPFGEGFLSKNFYFLDSIDTSQAFYASGKSLPCISSGLYLIVSQSI
ncbi:hypothetical protein HETIRDRAFT_323557, partial [Heterobasidion irregulare TC 32-1]